MKSIYDSCAAATEFRKNYKPKYASPARPYILRTIPRMSKLHNFKDVQREELVWISPETAEKLKAKSKCEGNNNAFPQFKGLLKYVNYRDYQLFAKRFRKYLFTKIGSYEKYLHTLYRSTLLRHSARISISYFSLTRTKSPKTFDKLYIRVGASVVSIRNLQGTQPVHMYRVILIALCLSPLFLQISRLQKISRGLANYLDMKAFDKQLKHLNKQSSAYLSEYALSVMASLVNSLPPFRISLDCCQDSYPTAIIFLSKLEQLLQQFDAYYNSLDETNPLKKKLQQTYPSLYTPIS